MQGKEVEPHEASALIPSDDVSSIEVEEELKNQPGAYYALAILTTINLLNYMDRLVPSATKSLYQEELHMTDLMTGAPASTFLIVYMIFSPIFAALCDFGFPRKYMLIFGVVWWSISTGAVFFANHFWDFTLYRTLVAVGEACYATIAPTLISDLFPPVKRNRAMTVFSMATPIGGALGFGVGALVGEHFGWRKAFLVCGAPGIAVSLLIFLIKDPGRNAYEAVEEKEVTVAWIPALKSLGTNRIYLTSLAGLTLLTWAVGAMADWLPDFLHNNTELSVSTAGIVVGGIAVLGGILGTITGSVLADFGKGKLRNSYMFVAAISILISAVCCLAMLLIVWKRITIYVVCTFMFLTQYFAWWYMGPINALQANVVSSHIRARSFSVTIIVIHLLGDGISPLIVGAISDKSGSQILALSTVPCFMLAAGIVWMCHWIFVKSDMQGLETPGPEKRRRYSSVDPVQVTRYSQIRLDQEYEDVDITDQSKHQGSVRKYSNL